MEESMRVIAKRTLQDYWTIHAQTKQPLLSWYKATRKAQWANPQDVKRRFTTASIVGNDRVVFNICGNNYRLVVKLAYRTQRCYVRFIGTHSQYDKVDVTRI